MLDSVKIQRRQSEIRQQLAELVGKDTPTEDETRSMESLDGEYRSNETRYRAALIAEDEERREAGAELETRSDQEWAEVMAGFEMRQAVLALDEGAALSGATAEVVSELWSQGGYRGIPVPLEALEQRAGETVASGVYDPKNTRPVVDRLFPASAMRKMGGALVNVPAGVTEWPVVTSSISAGWSSTETGNVSGPTVFATTDRSMSPNQTLGIQAKITRRSMKQSGPALEQAIRRDLAGAVAQELDNAAFLGSGSSGEPAGVVATANATYGITETAINAAPTWAVFRAAVQRMMAANAVSSPGEVKIMIRPEVWSDLDGALFDSGSGLTELDRMMKYIPAANLCVSSNGLAAPSGSPEVTSALVTCTPGGVPAFWCGVFGGASTRNGKPVAYRLSIPEIGGGRTQTALAAEVLHVRIGVDPAAPWAGTAPLRRAQITAGLLDAVEKSLADAFQNMPLGSQVVPFPESPETDMGALGRDFAGKRGRVLLRESVAVTAAGGPVPVQDWKPSDLSPDLSKSMTRETLDAARNAICMAFGVLPGMVNPATTGPLVRESQRNLAQWTLQPIAELIGQEASAKLGTEVKLDVMRPLQAFDAGGRARAMSQIVQTLALAKEAGVDPDVALKLVDWEDSK